MFYPYDPGLVVVTFKELILSGFADGTFVNCSRDEDTFSKRTGAQGDTTRVRNRNKNGRITVTLQQGSPANTILSNYALSDELTGLAYGPITVKEIGTNGATLIAAPVAWIVKPADGSFAQDAENREWAFDCYSMSPFIAGAGLVL